MIVLIFWTVEFVTGLDWRDEKGRGACLVWRARELLPADRLDSECDFGNLKP